MASEIKELRDKTPEELSVLLRERRDELMRSRFQKAIGQLEDITRIRRLRKGIARIETLMSERTRQAKG